MNKIYLVSMIFVGTMQATVHEVVNNSGKEISITFYSTSPRGNAQQKVAIKPGTNAYDTKEKCLQKIVIFEDDVKKIEKQVITCAAPVKITVDKKNGSWEASSVKK